jgi:hypothetical protein
MWIFSAFNNSIGGIRILLHFNNPDPASWIPIMSALCLLLISNQYISGADCDRFVPKSTYLSRMAAGPGDLTIPPCAAAFPGQWKCYGYFVVKP